MSIFAPWASKMGAAGDIAKTVENRLFSRVLGAGGSFWRLGGALDWVSGALDGSWLAGRLAGAGWEAGRPRGPHEPREEGQGMVCWQLGGQNHNFIKRPTTNPTLAQGPETRTRDSLAAAAKLSQPGGSQGTGIYIYL